MIGLFEKLTRAFRGKANLPFAFQLIVLSVSDAVNIESELIDLVIGCLEIDLEDMYVIYRFVQLRSQQVSF
jgi:hypothetical protein